MNQKYDVGHSPSVVDVEHPPPVVCVGHPPSGVRVRRASIAPQQPADALQQNPKRKREGCLREQQPGADALHELSERVRAVEARFGARNLHQLADDPAETTVSTGWDAVDRALGGGLRRGGLHEWFGVQDAGRAWSPPLCILTHLAWRFFDHTRAADWVIWIGDACRPYPRVLLRGDDQRLLRQSLFVAPRSAALRLWAIDLALRSPAVGCVVADISDFDRTATQRLQLLAKAESKMVLATRPPWQQQRHSAAQTRWRVSLDPNPDREGGAFSIKPSRDHEGAGFERFTNPLADARGSECRRETSSRNRPRWIVELLRCKGVRPAQEHRAWLVEWDRGESAIHLSSGVAGLAGPPQRAAPAGNTRAAGERSAFVDERSAFVGERSA